MNHVYQLSVCLYNKLVALYLLFVVTTSCIKSASCQTTDSTSKVSYSHRPNLVHFELNGNGGFLSINYERYLSNDFALRVGLGSLGYDDNSDSVNSQFSATPIAVVMGNYLLFDKIEIGAGTQVLLNNSQKCNITLFQHIEDNCASVWLTSRLGYRYLPAEGGFSFAASIVQYYNLGPFAAYTWFGLSVGYSF